MRDGSCTVDGNLAGTPNYYPSSFYTLSPASQYAQPDKEQYNACVVNFESQVVNDDYAQAKDFWQNVLPKEPGNNQQQNFVYNVAGHLSAVTGDMGEDIRNAVYGQSSPHLLTWRK